MEGDTELGDRQDSHRKILANQENSKRSTGPRTPQGKARSSQNARKHGLTGVVPIFDGEGKEDVQAFEKTRRGLYEYWQPVGWQEEKLVESIAAAYWRLNRADRYEAGFIQLTADHVTREQQRGRKTSYLNQLVQPRFKFQLRESSLGIDFVIRCVKALKAEVESGASLSEKADEIYRNYVGQPGDDFYDDCKSFRIAFERSKEAGRTEEANAYQADCLKLVDEQLQRLEENRGSIVAGEQRDLDSCRQMSALPDFNMLDRLCRYTTMISREIGRTIKELERLQNGRKKPIERERHNDDRSGG